MNSSDFSRVKMIKLSISNVFEGKGSEVSLQVLSLITTVEWSSAMREEVREYINELLFNRARNIRLSLFKCRSRTGKDWLTLFYREMKKLLLTLKRCQYLFDRLFPRAELAFGEVMTREIINYSPVRSSLKSSLVHCIGNAGEDEVVPRLVYETMSLLHNYGIENVQEDILSTVFVDALEGKYMPLAKTFLADHSVMEYIRWVGSVMVEVEDTWSFFLPRESDESRFQIQEYIRHALHISLITRFKEEILYGDTGFSSLIDTQDIHALKSFIAFYSCHCGTQDLETIILQCMMKHLQGVFCLLLSDPARVVEKTIEVLDMSSVLFMQLGKGSPDEEIVAELNKIGFAEAVSAFYDRTVKRMVITKSQAEIIKRLYHLVCNKEALDTALRNSMLVRLANAKEKSLVAERFFLEGIEEERRPPFERMINDVEHSWKLSKAFEEYKKNVPDNETEEEEEEKEGRKRDGGLSFQFTVNILRGVGVLPLLEHAPSFSCTFPEEMKACERDFLHFYARRHNGRRLRFLYRWGKVWYQLSHNEAVYTIVAPTSSSYLIEMFNSDNSFTKESLAEQCGMGLDAVENQLRLLQRKELIVEDQNEYRFNTTFSSLRKVLILDKEESADDDRMKRRRSPSFRTELSEDAMKIRSTTLESVTMKVLKSSSIIKDTELYEKVSENIHHFSVLRPMVKDALRSLLERGFIVRSSEGYVLQL